MFLRQASCIRLDSRRAASYRAHLWKLRDFTQGLAPCRLSVRVAAGSRRDFGLNAGPTLGAAMEFSEDQGGRTRRRGGMNARAKPGAKGAMGPSWQSGWQGTPLPPTAQRP